MTENKSNSFRSNYWNYNDDSIYVNTTTLDANAESDFTSTSGSGDYYFGATFSKSVTYKQSKSIWYRKYFSEIISYFGGLAASIYAFSAVFLAGFGNHA